MGQKIFYCFDSESKGNEFYENSKTKNGNNFSISIFKELLKKIVSAYSIVGNSFLIIRFAQNKKIILLFLIKKLYIFAQK
jgi:penicillin-binding protein-related factor A (putative recombinase)